MSKSPFFLVALVAMISSELLAQAKGEAIDGCRFDGKVLRCENYKSTRLPFKERFKGAESLYIVGTFDEITFDPGYDEVKKIQLVYGHGATQVSMSVFKVFKNLVTLSLTSASYWDGGASKITAIDLTGVGVMTSLRILELERNSISEVRGGTFKKCYPKLTSLDLAWNKLTRFDFRKVPNTLTYLDVATNQITKFVHKEDLWSFNGLYRLNVNFNKVPMDEYRYKRSYNPPTIN